MLTFHATDVNISHSMHGVNPAVQVRVGIAASLSLQGPGRLGKEVRAVIMSGCQAITHWEDTVVDSLCISKLQYRCFRRRPLGIVI